MTAEFLQECMENELERLLASMPLLSRQGENPGARMTVYKQNTPLREAVGEWDAPEELPPHAVVMLAGGKRKEFGEAEIAELIVGFCVYDNGLDRSGYLDVLHAVERVKLRFAKDHTLGGWFRLAAPPEWEIACDDEFPYYYGSMLFSFEIPAVEPEDEMA